MSGEKSNKNEVWSGIVLLVVVATLLSVYFLWMSSQDPEPDPPVVNLHSMAPVTDDVLYKTYTSETGGFRVQYPQNWFVEETASGDDAESIYSVEFRGESEGVTISSMPLSLEGVVRNSISVTEEETITVNGVPAQQLTGTDVKDGSSYSVILLTNQDRIFSISGSGQMFDEIVNYFELI